MKKQIESVISTATRGIRIVLFGSLSLVMMQAAEWRVGVVDGNSGGAYSSLRMDALGNAHVSYWSAANSGLVYSFWDHTLDKWFTTTVDRSSGGCSLALDSAQHPHISFIEYGTGRLKYAHWDGSSWKLQAIPVQARVIAYYTSITIDSEGKPTISFYEEIGAGLDKTRLRVVKWTGSVWELRTVDSDEGSGKFNFMVTDSAGHPQIAYGNVEYKNASLRYARWDGRSWHVEILEGEEGPAMMYSVATVIGPGDVPHIVYNDVNRGFVKYATKKNGKWETQIVDSVKKMGYPDRNGIALDPDGNPYLSYYDAGAGILKLAHMKDQKWVVEIVDKQFNGFNSSLQLYDNTIWLTYADSTGETLMFAHRPL